ncbi:MULTISPECIES: roadblock/LC7 domain-containing protein [Streptomyces]|uniref:Roadblock/LAMTOR2 domain-containing protein n=1 Tax=Streptomyces venezuelae TaxID=54571 RepID=A0A5P2BJX4_STRVZ|nr:MULTISPECIES: roadblock/LC7 domain-containing protein [Streptomyces]NEA02953.1 roadblock/LC7 domain-containing protein [Streptomyces sp. SID10116]MYY81148.1 roadblock/LC7 domain-containing protein [Streptomyces sp. SID335]MYZ13790.1 roadblock/LC7 domain-containing protein [Streptomyces sp. SID337]NDZ86808.1 roadblock/LC7 domain-containing protein [Streptomyces sp. SID10115]NEB49060.1 roadblock/LC7 domain-containing protein [Streptomyces sp. SID339]
MTVTTGNELGWLLDRALGSIEGVRHAVLMSSDGLLHSRTAGIGQDEAEKFAAITAAVRAAALAYDEETGGGGTRQALIELTNHVGLITQAGGNTMLSVQTTGPDADIGLITHHMLELAQRVGHEMKVAPRQPSQLGLPTT